MTAHRNAADLDKGNRISEHVRKDLARIERYYEPALTGPSATDESGISGPGRTDPANIAAVDARAEALHDLHFWCRFILDEINGGTIQTHVSPVIEDMAVFIARWTLAVTEQFPDDAEQLEHDMRHNADILEGLARGWRTQRVQVGRCPEQTIIGEPGQEIFTPCDGTLWSVVKVQSTMLPKVITCDRESEHSWQPWQWAALGKRLGRDIA